MKRIVHTLFFVTLFAVVKPVQARTIAAQAPATSWFSGAVGKAASVGASALPALGAIGTAAASSLIPFGLGPIATVAAPYLIAAGANYVTKKVSGIDIAAEKYREELQDQVGELTCQMKARDRRYRRLMRKIRNLRRARNRRSSMYMDDDSFSDADSVCSIDDDFDVIDDYDFDYDY